jgi:pyrroloquinoline quinone biosynthesis protein D
VGFIVTQHVRGTMATDRGRRRIGRGDDKRTSPRSTSNGVQLAAGVRLIRSGTKQKLPVLVYADEEVQLNEGALAILQLCDGSRSRDQIVEEAAQRSSEHSLEADIIAFLDAARARGWIVDDGVGS